MRTVCPTETAISVLQETVRETLPSASEVA
jgi:hypothetical protein